METQTPIAVTCPDCGGPLLAVRDGELHQLRCIVGHVYSPRSVLQAHFEREENVLWSAVVVLQEAATLVDTVAPELPEHLAVELKRQARLKSRQAAVIRRIIERLSPYEME